MKSNLVIYIGVRQTSLLTQRDSNASPRDNSIQSYLYQLISLYALTSFPLMIFLNMFAGNIYNVFVMLFHKELRKLRKKPVSYVLVFIFTGDFFHVKDSSDPFPYGIISCSF